MKLNPLKPSFLVLFTIIFITLSWSSLGQSEGVRSNDDTPILTSVNRDNTVLRFWAPPSTTLSIVYDQWQFIIFGQLNDTVHIWVNGKEIHNGTLPDSYMNVSFDASGYDRANIRMEIGNRSYQWANVIINHEVVDYNGPGSGSSGGGQYTIKDMNTARFKVALGVIITTLATIPLVKRMVVYWRSRQGVIQI